MKDIFKKNKIIIIATFSIFMFFLILWDVFRNEVTSYDNWAYSIFVEYLRNDTMTSIMKCITFCGGAVCLMSIVILLLIFLKNKKDAFFSVINIVMIFLINSLIKFIVQRPRPSGYNLITESNYSFPSGHSMVSTAVYGFLIYLIYKYVKNNKLKYFLISLIFILIILICISRIYLGVHYLSDTLAGFFFSIFYLMIIITLYYKIIKRGSKNDKEKTSKN